MSNESKHTPGPWHVEMDIETDEPRFDGLYAVSDMGADLICELPSLENARLIAAAPTMYEVCKEALERIRAFDHKSHGDHETITALEAAIAKAEGHHE